MRPVTTCLLVVLALLCPPPASAGDGPPDGAMLDPAAFAAEVGRMVDARLPRPAVIGMAVLDLATGRLVHDRDAGTQFTPASVAKLATAAAALELLGPAFRFETELFYDGRFEEGRLNGNLYLIAGGDPCLVTEELARLGAELRMAGLERVSGDLVLVADRFDDRIWPPGWELDGSDSAYRAPITSLSANYNAVAVTVLPGSAAGRPGRVIITPDLPGYFTLDNRVTTVAGDRRRKVSISISARGQGDRITVRGRIPAGDPGETDWRRVSRPVEHAGELIVRSLAAAGVRIDGRRRTASPTAQELAGLQPLLTFRSQPLASVVAVMNKHSSNVVAEMVVKTLSLAGVPESARGTFEGGLEAIRAFLESEVGLVRGSYLLENGSGLSRATRFSPHQLARILAWAAGRPGIAPEYLASLSLAGLDGTTRKRFKAGRIDGRFKTGSLRDVSAIGGYVRTQEGRALAVVVLINAVPEGKLRVAADLADDLAALATRLRPAPSSP